MHQKKPASSFWQNIILTSSLIGTSERVSDGLGSKADHELGLGVGNELVVGYDLGFGVGMG